MRTSRSKRFVVTSSPLSSSPSPYVPPGRDPVSFLPATRPESYQDVKTTLMWYTAAVTAISLIFLLFPFVLPPQHRADALNFLTSTGLPDIVGWGLILFLVEFVAWLL